MLINYLNYLNYNKISYIKYIFLIFICIILAIFVYIRFKYRFWCLQPVFHLYDLHYYLFPPGIIQYSFPEKNKYCNFKNIKTLVFSNIEDFKINKFMHFIQSHYLQNKENIFLPVKDNIVPYFTGHNDKCFISFYEDSEFLLDIKTNSTIEDNKIISVMTSRPLHVYINNGNRDAYFDAYYVDYLCVDKNYRKKGIAPQMIQTHHYNQRLLSKEIQVSLFKREGELTGIVPLCVYSTYWFNMSTWKKPPKMPHEYGVIEIGPKNAHHLVDFLKLKNAYFDIVIIPEISNMLELIKTNNIYCYLIVQNYEVLCAYFFRKSCTFIKKNEEILSCFASINASKNYTVFLEGFKVCLWKICKKHTGFKFTVIENISDNDKIIKDIMIRTSPYFISPSAYFFYNFAYFTFKPNKCLIIN